MEIETGERVWYQYAESYRDAADALVENALKDSYVLRTVGPPMMFLYRHYIELHLKSLLSDAGELLDDPQAIPPQHYIRELWQRVRVLLLKVDPQSDGEWFARADDVIKQFDELDPRSFAFRYPVATNQLPSLKKPLIVDPINVRRMITELHILLSGASSQIDVYMEFKHEPM